MDANQPGMQESQVARNVDQDVSAGGMGTEWGASGNPDSNVLP